MSLFILVFLFCGVLFVAVSIVAVLYGSRRKSSRDKKSLSQKEREKLIARSKRKLNKNPQDYRALLDLANIYFENDDFPRAMHYYSIIYSLPTAQLETDFVVCALRMGLSAIRLEKYDVAIGPLEFAVTRFPSSFEAQYALGLANFKSGNFLRASVFLCAALKINPDSLDAQKQYALCCFKQGEFQRAVPLLQAAFAANSEDSDITFALAMSFYKSGTQRSAQRYFELLKDDPQYGAESCLALGDMANAKGAAKTAFDCYYCGMNSISPSTRDEIKLALIYGTVCYYLKQSDIAGAISGLQKIVAINPNFKNASEMLAKYSELNQNMNLRIFSMGKNDEFLALCKAIITKLHPRAHIKFQQPAFSADFLEFFASVTVDSHENLILARFYRERGSVGDVSIRDFYAKMREIRASSGICFSAGVFSDESMRFCEGRQVFLWNRDKLLKLLDGINQFGNQDGEAFLSDGKIRGSEEKS